MFVCDNDNNEPKKKTTETQIHENNFNRNEIQNGISTAFFLRTLSIWFEIQEMREPNMNKRGKSLSDALADERINFNLMEPQKNATEIRTEMKTYKWNCVKQNGCGAAYDKFIGKLNDYS